MNAALLRELIDSEAGARGLALPSTMTSSGGGWELAYPRQASKAAEFPAEFHRLEAALEVVGTCLNPILGQEPVTGIWDPQKQSWLV